MADFSKFRTSIGGFHRGDVADYIEAMAIEHKKDLRRLNDANEKLESEKTSLAAALTRMQAELTSVKKELDDKTAELERTKAELEQTKEEDASLQQQVESLAQEASELAQRAADAEEKVASQEEAPEETAPEEESGACICEPDAECEDGEEPSLPEKELEAYRRAEAMERNALTRAERLKAKLSQLCDGARTRYTDSGEELEALTQDLTSVLDRMRDTLADLQVAFDETENAFDELESMNAE